MENTDVSKQSILKTVIAAGTVYALTATAAAIDFGTTDPVVVPGKKGRYQVSGFVTLNYAGATFASSRTVTIKVRRTNNTAADIVSLTLPTGVVTTLTDFAGMIQIPPTEVFVMNDDDSFTLFGDVSVVPSAGALNVTNATLTFKSLD